jgi:hypothetical protein
VTGPAPDTGEGPVVDREAAAAQLAALQADRAALADRVMQPWWYDLALGLLLFGFLASYAADSLWVTFPVMIVFFGGLGVLVAAYKRITGVWVNAGRRALIAWAALVLLVLVPAFVLAQGYGHHWVMVPAGAVLGIAVIVMGRIWGRAYVEDLRQGGL